MFDKGQLRPAQVEETVQQLLCDVKSIFYRYSSKYPIFKNKNLKWYLPLVRISFCLNFYQFFSLTLRAPR